MTSEELRSVTKLLAMVISMGWMTSGGTSTWDACRQRQTKRVRTRRIVHEGNNTEDRKKNYEMALSDRFRHEIGVTDLCRAQHRAQPLQTRRPLIPNCIASGGGHVPLPTADRVQVTGSRRGAHRGTPGGESITLPPPTPSHLFLQTTTTITTNSGGQIASPSNKSQIATSTNKVR